MDNLDDIALLAPPGDEEDDSSDPRKRLLMNLSLRALQSLGSGDGGNGGNGDNGASPSPSPSPSPSRDSLSTMTGDDLASAGIMPSGFDSTGMPTEFPATATKNAARDRLQRATAPPAGGIKNKLIRAGLTLAPAAIGFLGHGDTSAMAGAAGGAVEAEESRRQEGEVEKSRATQAYQFEAGQEEHQRESALRERIAMSQMASQRAYRSLMTAMTQRKNDQTAANAATRNEVAAANQGNKIVHNPDGTLTVQPRTMDELNIVKQHQVSLQQATEDLRRAQAAGIPEQIKIKKDALDIQRSMLEKSLSQLDLQTRTFAINYYGIDPSTGAPPPGQPMIDGQVVGTRNKMPTVIEDRAQQAQTIAGTSADLINSIKANKSVIGPIMGRYGSLTDFVGNPPPEYARMASELVTYIALQPAAHGFRGLRAVAEFEKSIGTPIRTPEALIAAIEGNVAGLHTMAGRAGRFTGGATPGDLRKPPALKTAPATSGSERLKRGHGGRAGSGGSAGSTGNMPPPGAKIRDYTDFVNQ